MSILMGIIVFSILVFIHEFGHFLLAKKNGVKVIEFSIGFGPNLISFVRGETRYSFKAIPFGGACQMLNKEMVPEEEMANEDLTRAFESKSVWARMSIVLAGPIFNFVLAFVLAIVVIGVVGYDEPLLMEVEADSPAAEAGLMEGDIITEYNGVTIDISREIYLENYIHPISDKPIKIKYLRDGKEYETTLTPRLVERYVMGISYSLDADKIVLEAVTEGSPLAEAGAKVGDVIVSFDGVNITDGNSFNDYINAHPLTVDERVITVDRDGKRIDLTIKPMKTGSYYIGFSYNVGRVKTDAIGVLKYSVVEIGYQISTVFKSLGMLFTGQVTVNDFSGPVGIVDFIDDAYEESKSEGPLMVFLNIANLTMLLSANLGVMNLLPIPGLDGGRFFFQILEVILRRPVKHEEYFHLAGMILLMLFAVYIMFQDIFKLF